MTTDASLSGTTKSAEEQISEVNSEFLVDFAKIVSASDITSDRGRLLASIKVAEVEAEGHSWDAIVAAALFRDMSDREIDTLILNIRKMCKEHREWRRGQG
ncbi:MAG: hypothetical protein OXD50_00155 [Chloroflexi bacterium]|nr:hypothetical protein [Chloroflexota bacterium]